jgi:hypothetical protein
LSKANLSAREISSELAGNNNHAGQWSTRRLETHLGEWDCRRIASLMKPLEPSTRPTQQMRVLAELSRTAFFLGVEGWIV